MNSKRLDGRAAARDILAHVQEEVAAYPSRKPQLVCIILGNDDASHTYVAMKQKRCESVGMHSQIIALEENTAQDELLRSIRSFNEDPSVDGILVQSPLPAHIDPHAVTAAIDPNKDVDGFHPINMGKLMAGDPTGFVPCTPLGIYTLLHTNGIAFRGKHVVILGRSSLVGKPLAALLSQKGIDATVTLAHSQTRDIATHTLLADIVVAAMGKPHSLTCDMIREGATVVDVGITRSDQGLLGDINPRGIEERAAYFTPVPGGVGPMTVAMLLYNTLKSFKQQL